MSGSNKGLRKALLGAAAALLIGQASPVLAAEGASFIGPQPKPKTYPLTLTPAERLKALEEMPDWSGVWQNGTGNGTVFDTSTVVGAGLEQRVFPPYNAEWEAMYVAFLDRQKAGYISDPYTYCLHGGMPRMMTNPMSFEFLVTPEVTWMINEYDSQVRRVFTDGREHPADHVPDWSGHSIGHWEGDTLVVHTVGLREHKMIEGIADMITDRSGPMLSGKAEILERIRKVGPDLIEDLMTVYDPVALVRPWQVVRLFRRSAAGTFVADTYCEEALSHPAGERNPMVGGVTQAVLPGDAEGHSLSPEDILKSAPVQ